VDLLISGNTPLVQLEKDIYAKLELCNPTGSIKDRVIEYILNEAFLTGKIKDDTILVEASSGNTGISLASFGATYGLKTIIVMPSDMSEERKMAIKTFGAEIIETEPGGFDKAIEIRNTLSKRIGWFSPMQFENPLNIECHRRTTGAEIVKQLNDIGKVPAYLVAGTGTGGTIMGCMKALKKLNPFLKVIAVEPFESPVMSGGSPAPHKIQGIGDGSKFLVDMKFVDKVITIKEQDAIDNVKKLAKSTGYFAGISANANFLASKIISKEQSLRENECIITILCDRGQRYYSMLKG